jgi:dihydropteroate synthase
LAVIFRARQFEFGFPRPAVVMGVVNVTPDSFSDGGKFLNAEAAVAHALKLVEQGAEILDVGGESTRPGATPVGEAEELRRVIPVIEKISAAAKVCVSIDTQKPMVARAALAAGASIVNDIAANRNDDEMWRVVADSGAGYVCMHMQGSPLTMQIEPIYADVVREVGEFFAERLCQLAAAGVTPEQVVLDAGIGFGKTVTQNVALLAAQKQFLKLGRPLLLGVSRKSFLGKISGAEVNERLPAALACTTLALADGVQFFRTHDVAETVQAVRAAEAVFSK